MKENKNLSCLRSSIVICGSNANDVKALFTKKSFVKAETALSSTEESKQKTNLKKPKKLLQGLQIGELTFA